MSFVGNWVVIRNSAFGRYWLARTISLLGDGIVLTTLVLFGTRFSHAGLGVGGLLFARTAPRFLAPLAGGVADRFNRRRVMLACDLGQAVIYLTIALLLPGYAPLVALIAAASVFATLFAPASGASVPDLVPTPSLPKANAWIGASLNVQVAAGPVIAAVLVAFAGYRWAFLLNALTFLISAPLVFFTRRIDSAERDKPTGVFSGTATGFGYVVRDRILGPTMVMWSFASLLLSTDTVLLVLLTHGPLHVGALGYGYAATAFGLGMIGSSAVLIRFTLPARPMVQFLVALTVGGIAMAMTGITPVLALTIAAQVVGGLANGVENASSVTFFQTYVPGSALGRVLGLSGMATFGAGSLVS